MIFSRFFEYLVKELSKMEQSSKAIQKCPRCGSFLQKRNGKFGEFWGCTGYPILSLRRMCSKDLRYEAHMITDELIIKMAEFNAGNPKRIQHFIKVYDFAHVIGVKEKIDEAVLRILDMASIMHDIGIRPAEEKYGQCNGKLQEQEGPVYARDMLAEFPEVTNEETERVCYLIAHHHTYENVDGIDYRILLEADFLVNAMEDNLDKDAIIHFRDRVFETKTGLHLINTMFGL